MIVCHADSLLHAAAAVVAALAAAGPFLYSPDARQQGTKNPLSLSLSIILDGAWVPLQSGSGSYRQ